MRRVITRFEAHNIRANQPLLGLLTRFAQQKSATPAQPAYDGLVPKDVAPRWRRRGPGTFRNRVCRPLSR
ncbi:hypothetical protein [Streptomyces violens]|uniref:hypothetical protein n=1 Tax=Streptomyces violens TaxID=66377 RepID=UPI0004BF74BF|nr:hypothetical protein [Streptomyces violens]